MQHHRQACPDMEALAPHPRQNRLHHKNARGGERIEENDALIMDYDVSLSLEDVSCIEFIKKHGLQPYFYKLTVYLPIFIHHAKNEQDVKPLEEHYKHIANLYLNFPLRNEDIPVIELMLVLLTNCIGSLRGKLGLPPSQTVMEYMDKIEKFLEENRGESP